MNISNWYRRFLIGGLYALLFIPLVVSDFLFFPFITGKNFAFRIIVEILTALWLLACLQEPRMRPRRGILLWLVSGLTVAVLLSTVVSVDPYRSFWSNFERMEGAITYIHLFLYFVVLISTLSNIKMWRRFWQINLIASMSVSAIALAQIFGFYAIHQGSVRLDATLGNSAYLAVYMLFGFFYTVLLWVDATRGSARRYWYPLCALIQLFVLYKTATRGAILGVLFGLFVTSILIWFRGKEYPLARRIAGISIAAVLLVVGIFFVARNTSFVQTSPVLSRFAAISLSERTTESRLIIWRMSLKGFAEHPLFGWGPENYSVVFNKYYDPHLWRQEPWFDRSHNVLIDWLVMTGLVGALFYLSLYGAGLMRLWSKKTSFSFPERAILTGLLCAYLFQNLFVFDNLISLILFIATLGYIHVRATEESLPRGHSTRRILVPLWGKGLVAVVTVGILYYANARPLIASADLIQALTPQKGGITINIATFKKIFNDDTFANSEASLQLISLAQNVLVEPSIPTEFKQSFSRFVTTTIENEIDRHPTDARPIFIYGTFLSRFNQTQQAEKYLNKALLLSPQKQSIILEIAASKLTTGHTVEGLALFKKAFDLDQNYIEARKMYALAAITTENLTLGNALMTEIYGTKAVPDRRFAIWYASQKNYKRAAESLENMLQENERLSDDDMFLLAGLSLYAGNRDRSLAVLETLKTKAQSDATRTKAEQLGAAVKAGLNPFTLE